MTELERTQSSFIEHAVEGMVQNVRVGRVQQVFEHIEEDDKSNFEVDVKILGEDVQHRSIPYQHNSHGEIYVPSVGDKVMVEYREGQKKLPIARNIVYTNRDRPPIGSAGMWRKRIESDTSPAGDGDLYIESYTEYDEDPSQTEVDNASVIESWIRLAKKASDDDTDDLPVNIELYDSPDSDEAHVIVELNKEDGTDTGPTWGLKFDLKTGEIKLLDASGYGIVSDGDGNFTWHHETINESQGTTDTL